MRFGTKEQFKKEKEEAFIALSPTERFIQFLHLLTTYEIFETPVPDRSKHFVITQIQDDSTNSSAL